MSGLMAFSILQHSAVVDISLRTLILIHTAYTVSDQKYDHFNVKFTPFYEVECGELFCKTNLKQKCIEINKRKTDHYSLQTNFAQKMSL